ncbi:MAG: DUF3347 domain-containing protein [Reichenbachiella sp.]|uniref:DUF3347 domain-containing protein n=1 Tax=Reichenbachiella sp. TaxID=2184521 RepID=UPI002966C3CD|nr:DUF3347 domain-containing protein [Reichenbachiella sp.]MDW3212151.1 DUF3347 domain-containing protein [Reichenbachiella sp.]
MKKQIMMIAALFVALGAYAQHDHSQKEGSKMDHSMHAGMTPESGQVMTYDTPSEFRNQLGEVYKTSLVLTENFITGEGNDISNTSAQVKEILKKVDMNLLKSSEAHMDWMMNLKEMNSALETISNTAETKTQKTAYASFNQALYKSVKAFGTTESTIYYQHCPMALDNQGAFWLSNSKEIRNPYFGGSMLTCGSTKEMLN